MSATGSMDRRDYWNQAALECGPKSLDKELSETSSWDDVLATGEADLAEAMKATELTFGRERSALEIGCGAGRMTHALGLRYERVLAVDIAPRMIEMAQSHRQLENVSFVLANEQSIVPPEAGTFDTIFSYEVFHYLPTDLLNHYLRTAYSLLNPGGELVFQLNAVPISRSTRISMRLRTLMFTIGIKQWRGWSNDPAFQRQYHSPERIVSQLESIGFKSDRPNGHLRQTWFRAVRSDAG